jgi:Fe-S-cluster containining protein
MFHVKHSRRKRQEFPFQTPIQTPIQTSGLERKGEVMSYSFEEIFSQYKKLADAADQIFRKMKKDFPKEMTCKAGCSDCCWALFDVSLVESLYLNHHFNRLFEGAKKAALIENANRADRTAYKIKRDARKKLEKGQAEEDVLVSLSAERIRCPLLNKENQCVIYEHRPITCRLYGVPMEIGGLTHSCGQSGFIKGTPYPTVHMDKMNQQLFGLADRLVKEMGSKYSQLTELVMPVSAALLTEFNDEFLGIGDDEKQKDAGES